MHTPLSPDSGAIPKTNLVLANWPLRVAAIYVALYFLPFPLTLTPLGPHAQNFTLAIWEPLVHAAAGLFGVSVPTLPGGSGDTTFNYIQLALTAALALAIGSLWSVLARGLASPTTRWALRTALRYALSYAMLSYGLAKILLQQFPAPNPDRLLTTFGESSPMGLLWTTMGHSPAYQIFGGLAECLGGLLLLSRRTATLGALITAGIMSQVVMLNLCFDVPVKLYSAQLLLFALALLIPDARRLLDVFVRNKTVPPSPLAGAPRPFGTMGTCIKAAVLLSLTATLLLEALAEGPPSNELSLAPVAGTYLVTEGSDDSASSVPEDAHPAWIRFTVEPFGVLSARATDGSRERFRIESLDSTGAYAATPLSDPGAAATIRIEPMSVDRVRLTVRTKDLARTAEGTRLKPQDFRLRSGKFRWVNEFPDNR